MGTDTYRDPAPTTRQLDAVSIYWVLTPTADTTKPFLSIIFFSFALVVETLPPPHGRVFLCVRASPVEGVKCTTPNEKKCTTEVYHTTN